MVDTSNRPMLALQAWLSPAYPVGAYAYSHGLEWAVETGSVTDRGTLRMWLDDNLKYGTGWNDAIFIVEIFRRVTVVGQSACIKPLVELAALAAGLCPSGELRQESLQQGAAFIAVTRKAWPEPLFDAATEAFGDDTPYPICFGLAAAAHGCPLPVALQGYLFAVASNWISAAVRLNVVGQTGAQEMAAECAAMIEVLVEDSLNAGLDDIGGCAFLTDIASFCHEGQYSRLFRS